MFDEVEALSTWATLLGRGSKDAVEVMHQRTGTQHTWEKIMKKLSLFAFVSAALVCAAMPASFNWPQASLAACL
jgi:hypothetical protein